MSTTFRLSNFGNKMTRSTGISILMDDLGKALSGSDKVYMLGGGNPAHIAAVEAIWRKQMHVIMASENGFEKMLGNYDTPQGMMTFIDTIVDFFNRNYGWGIKADNVAITNGSQSACFFLFNLFAGTSPQGKRKILLPIAPEYIGYTDQGIEEDIFVSRRPIIEELPDHQFKYHVDFDNLHIGDDIGAICISRPTNPTGNVITDEELDRLSVLARAQGIPLIVDNAYGNPFPQMIFSDATLQWNDQIVHSFSLSKIGLPGTRTGIVIAHPETVAALAAVNAVVSLANGSIGQALTLPLFQSDAIVHISATLIKPFYANKSKQATAWIRQYFDGLVDYRMHKCEGSFFFWLWFPGLKIDSMELYQRLKARKVLVVPGNFFFPGLDEEWQHKHECLRMSYAQNSEDVRQGIEIMAEVLQQL